MPAALRKRSKRQCRRCHKPEYPGNSDILKSHISVLCHVRDATIQWAAVASMVGGNACGRAKVVVDMLPFPLISNPVSFLLLEMYLDTGQYAFLVQLTLSYLDTLPVPQPGSAFKEINSFYTT